MRSLMKLFWGVTFILKSWQIKLQKERNLGIGEFFSGCQFSIFMVVNFAIAAPVLGCSR